MTGHIPLALCTLAIGLALAGCGLGTSPMVRAPEEAPVAGFGDENDEGRRRQAAYFATRGTTPERALVEKWRLTQEVFESGAPNVAPAAPAPSTGGQSVPAQSNETPAQWQAFSGSPLPNGPVCAEKRPSVTDA